MIVIFFCYRKAESECLLVLLEHESDVHIASQTDWINGSFTDFSRFMFCLLIRIEKLNWPPQKPPFLFALALIHTVCIQPNNK